MYTVCIISLTDGGEIFGFLLISVRWGLFAPYKERFGFFDLGGLAVSKVNKIQLFGQHDTKQ